jgi:hypothetical protein
MPEKLRVLKITHSTYPLFFLLSILVLLATPYAKAQPYDGAEGGDSSKPQSEYEVSDENISGPYSEYGEFDSEADEAADEKFFQFGRFFGVGIGAGSTVATGNAGRIYQGGFPTLDFRLAYWFDFNFAFQLGVQNSKHQYDLEPDGLTAVNNFRILFEFKYYPDTRNLSAPITFIGPHLIAGGGYYQRTDNIGSGESNPQNVGVVQAENAFGFNFGAGLEFTLQPKKSFLQIEGMMHLVQFGDHFDTKFRSAGINDRSGAWVSVIAALLFTW